MKKISEYTIEELEKLLELLRWQYDHEDKPLYKRHIGGRILTILKEIKNRNIV